MFAIHQNESFKIVKTLIPIELVILNFSIGFSA